MLKRKAMYENCDSGSKPVQFLFRALHAYSQEDRQNFLIFCWGRARLPPTEDSPLWQDGFQIVLCSGLPPTGLPMAHTCFFRIDLPMYPTYELCHERLLVAIRNCITMQNN